MSWTSFDTQHEGRAAAEFPDGRVSTGSTADGASVQVPGGTASATPGAGPEVVDGRTAIGWRGLCSCGWQGPLWRRVPAAADAAPARRLIYWASPGPQARPQANVEYAIRREWDAHLPSPAIAAVKSAATAARKAGEALDGAVRRARLAGESWAAIGDAAGLTEQAANERWQAAATAAGPVGQEAPRPGPARPVPFPSPEPNADGD